MSYYKDYYWKNREVILERQKAWQRNKYAINSEYRKLKCDQSKKRWAEIRKNKPIIVKEKKQKVKKLNIHFIFKLKNPKPKIIVKKKNFIKNSNCSQILSNILGGL